MPILNVVDLELNQPSRKIIQIGATSIDMASGKEYSCFNVFVDPSEKIDPYIVSLTGINQHVADEGKDVSEALELFWDWLPSKRVAAWGRDVDHLLTLSDDLGIEYPRKIKNYNLLQMFDLFRPAIGKGTSGLLATLKMLDLEFEGAHHNALDDARNAARVANVLFSRLRKYSQVNRLVLDK